MPIIYIVSQAVRTEVTQCTAYYNLENAIKNLRYRTTYYNYTFLPDINKLDKATVLKKLSKSNFFVVRNDSEFDNWIRIDEVNVQ